MLNETKLKQVLAAYRRDFHKKKTEAHSRSQWEDERYKWIAVKHFQDHWDIDASDFVTMFTEATAKHINLLDSVNYYPRGMIINFAKADPEAVRKMYRELFDEDVSVVTRADHFIEEAEKLRIKYGAEKWNSHYQNANSISTYLWLKYPDKYYIYKYSECKKAAEVLESDFKVKKGAGTAVYLDFFKFYDEIASCISGDAETTELVRSALTPACYSDPYYHTLTMDVGFYICHYYLEQEIVEPPIVLKETKYWPSNEEYPVNITKEGWKKYIEDVEFPYHKGCLKMLKGLMELGGEASCKKLSEVYGGSPSKYVGYAVNIGKRAKKYFNLPPCMDGDIERYFPIPFLGRQGNDNSPEYYSYKIRPALLEALKEIDLSSIDPYAHTEETNGLNYWWLNANPKIWSYSDLAVGAQQTYTLYNDNGNKRRIFQNFLDAKAGDLVIGYESTPVKQIVALARISKEHDDKELFFEKTEGLANPIEYATLKECPELADMEYFSQPQGSLFKLTKDEYDFILDLIREENPLQLETEVKKYTKEDFLKQVYMPETRYDHLKAVLLEKMNIILQGAPGVGKTYAAKRLAYSIMGEMDDNRIEFVQFHQNYSYEDFVMGYKPSGDVFELKSGVFYRFCQKAASQPQKQFFFIIDEINRGNMSKIFGELLMLIEKEYRGTKATLAYSGLPFSVPENLYIIGMMNTADRSLAMIDYALRRRFSFFDMEPAFNAQRFIEYKDGLHNETLNNLVECVQRLNDSIKKDKSLGKGFCIGHSYFCGKKECTDEWLHSIVEYDIIPMISEYWFDEPSTLQHWEEELRGVIK